MISAPRFCFGGPRIYNMPDFNVDIVGPTKYVVVSNRQVRRCTEMVELLLYGAVQRNENVSTAVYGSMPTFLYGVGLVAVSVRYPSQNAR